ncbi:MAG: GNAT family N-acetyltransferase [Rubripirellula sp.]
MEFVTLEFESCLYRQAIALRDELLRAPLGLIFTEEDLQAEWDQLHFGATTDESLIACALIVRLSEMSAKLRQMAVRTSHQRKGVGKFLIQSIESELLERGFRQIELNARDVAVGFYEKLGYTKVGEPFIEVKIPHWKMTKILAV